MLPEDMVEAVNRMVSGIRAKDYVTSISSFHRIQASPGIHEAISYVKDEIEKVSDAKIEIFEYPANGKRQIETFVAPFGWFPSSGTLELLEPERKRLADFQAEPISLIAHSVSAEMESEVVYVGKALSPEDLKDKDIKGKIVLTENLATIAFRPLCVMGGAAGLLTYVPPSGQDEIANLRRYDAFWPGTDEGKTGAFGFSLRQKDGLEIKDLLESGKTVKVKAKVDAALKTGKTSVLSALIEGKDPNKEFWLIAHVCHPHEGANDNASGSGALMEAMRVISGMIREEVIPQPECSLRFLWVPEWFGTIEFIQNENAILSRCLAVLNLDMVGADPAKSGSVLHLNRTPFSLPTTFNNVVRYWQENEGRRKVDRSLGGTMAPLPFAYSIYAAGSDHFMFTDKTVGIPSVMLNQSPDRFYHTSTDTIEKIDPNQMSYVTRIAILSSLTYTHSKHVCKEILLTWARDEAVELMRKVSHESVRNLARCVGDPEEVYPKTLRWLGRAQDLGQATLDVAAEEWNLISEQKSFLEALKTSLQMVYTTEMVVARKAYEGACAEVGLEAQKDDQLIIDTVSLGIAVRRKVKYPINIGYFSKKMIHKIPRYLELRKSLDRLFERIDEIVNLSEEWTTLDEIWDSLCFQFGDFEIKTLVEIVEDLTEAGLVESKETESA
ncbi:MAG: DUF4910 domain-containing protein [Candidatus Thorarchaeota archaeon]|jgi:hypothetical protein